MQRRSDLEFCYHARSRALWYWITKSVSLAPNIVTCHPLFSKVHWVR
jgi:hypothetical protein